MKQMIRQFTLRDKDVEMIYAALWLLADNEFTINRYKISKNRIKELQSMFKPENQDDFERGLKLLNDKDY